MLDRSFYLSQLIATRVPQVEMPAANNRLTLMKATRVGGMLAGVATLAVVVVVVYASGDGGGN